MAETYAVIHHHNKA